jgi:triphosphatase
LIGEKQIFIYRKGAMEYEIELKLLTNEQAGEIIETKLLQQLNANITKETHVLTNHYFDTADRILRQHDIGLRIRGNNHKFEQTLKTAGKSIGGLHQRPEYNVQLDTLRKPSFDKPELRLFPLSAWPDTINVGDLQTKIDTLFTTHFERKVYVLELLDGNIVELVWDVGEVTSGSKSVPICEIELELKQGDTSAIFDVAKRIASLMATSIGTDSKAARGYHLLDGFPVSKSQQYSHKLPANTQTTAEHFVSLLSTQLHDFQKFSSEIRLQHSQGLVVGIEQVLVGLVDSVTAFKHHFPCQSLDGIHIKLAGLVSEWSLISQKNNENDSHAFLTQASTTQLQLDVVQCLVEQPWLTLVRA